MTLQKFLRRLLHVNSRNKDFNTLIGNKQFFDEQVKNKQEVYEKCIDMFRY